MNLRLRFAVASENTLAEAALAELGTSLARICPIELSPVLVSNYAALHDLVESDRSLAAWAPPLVAFDLLRARAAAPVAAIGRKGRTTYYSALVASKESRIASLGGLRGARMGWVSKLSAAGYVVPRLYLEASGFHVEDLFAEEKIAGTHGHLVRMLVGGEVDAIATYAAFQRHGARFDLHPELEGQTTLATVGPIPGDVIVAGSALPKSSRDALRGGLLGLKLHTAGLLARLMHIDRFEAATAAHLESIGRWRERAFDGALRPLGLGER